MNYVGDYDYTTDVILLQQDFTKMQHFYVAALRFCENHGLFICYNIVTRRGRLVVYGAALERRFTRKGIEGSNPSLSAKLTYLPERVGR